MHRELARRGDGRHAETHGVEHDLAPELDHPPRHLVGRARQGAQHRVSLDQTGPHALGGQHDERLRLAQRQQAHDVIEIAVGQGDGSDGCVARRARVQRREALDLPEHVG